MKTAPYFHPIRSYKFYLYILSATALIHLSGCASRMIGVKPGASDVSLQDASAVSGCKPLGKTTVNVITQFGIYTRSVEDVEANLLQMARNSALDSNADTVVKEEMPEYGRRTFALYKCKN